MTDELEKRAAAIKRAAEYRERAANYASLSKEAEQRGDAQMSVEFARKAADEEVEANRIEAGIK